MAWDTASAFRQLIKLFSGGTAMADAVTVTNATDFIPLADHPCNSVTFVNDSGVSVQVKIKSSTKYITVFDGSYFTFDGINNTQDLSVRRKSSTGSVEIQYIYNY